MMHPRNNRLAHAVPTLPVTGLLYVGAVLLKPAPLPSLEEVIQEEETREEAHGLTPAPCICCFNLTQVLFSRYSKTNGAAKIYKAYSLLRLKARRELQLARLAGRCQDCNPVEA